MKEDKQVGEMNCGGAMSLSMEIVDRMNEGVGLTRCSDGTVVYGNPAVVRMFGYTPEEVIGNHFSKLLTSADKAADGRAAQVVEHLRQHNAWNGEVQSIRKDGSSFWVHMMVTTLNHPQYGEVWMGVYEDITESKRAQEQLREDRETILALLDASSESAGLVKIDGTILAANATFAARLGSRVEELVGRNVFEMFPPDLAESRKKRMLEAVRSGKAVRFQDQRDTRTFDITFCPVRDAEGQADRVALFATDITEQASTMKALNQANGLLKEMAHTDEVTSLPNRRAFLEALSRELHRITRYNGQAVTGLLDVDNFKALNDSHGHAVGDQLLMELGGILRVQLRQSDTVARFGGDEFVVLMPNVSTEGAMNVIERVRVAARGIKGTPDGKPMSVSFSAGLTAIPKNSSCDSVLQLADAALYDAKKAGRNCTKISPGLPS